MAFSNFVRCYAWEKSFESRIQGIRNEELSWFRKAQLLSAVWLIIVDFVLPVVNRMHLSRLQLVNRVFFLLQFNSFILNSIPVVVTVVSFGVYVLLGGDLTPARAFTSLSLFAVLRFPLNMLPNLLSQVSLTVISSVISYASVK